uniref:Calcineurin-like phosphoesterase domain-containing protein n=1 Tax=Ditylenchus dipsaci TaxID=166011 RepID=A0A915D0P4_9BILA
MMSDLDDPFAQLLQRSLQRLHCSSASFNSSLSVRIPESPKPNARVNSSRPVQLPASSATLSRRIPVQFPVPSSSDPSRVPEPQVVKRASSSSHQVSRMVSSSASRHVFSLRRCFLIRDFTSAASVLKSDSHLTPNQRKVRSAPDVGKVLQLTDFHYDRDYSVKGSPDDMCHTLENKTPKKDLGMFGDHKCDSPKSLVESAIMAAKEVVEKPDFIIWTGDSVPHIYNYDENYVANALEVTTNLLRQHFPGTTILPVYGNHDNSPTDNFPDIQTFIYYKTFEMWKPWIGEQAEETFLNGGYYKYTAADGTIFLMLNTNLYYTSNPLPMHNSTDPAGQFEFMEKALESAQSSGKSVHMAAHISPGALESKANFTWMYPQYNRRMLDITIKYAKTIKWMVFGHHHTDTFHLVKNQQGEDVQLMLMCPAVTLDIKTYYVSLDELNKDNSTKWSLEYSMKEAYSMDNISPQSFAKLVRQFESSENSSIFETYMKHNTVKNDVAVPYGAEKASHICSLKYVDLDDYYKCLDNKTSGAHAIKLITQIYMNALLIVAGLLFVRWN